MNLTKLQLAKIIERQLTEDKGKTMLIFIIALADKIHEEQEKASAREVHEKGGYFYGKDILNHREGG